MYYINILFIYRPDRRLATTRNRGSGSENPEYQVVPSHATEKSSALLDKDESAFLMLDLPVQSLRGHAPQNATFYYCSFVSSIRIHLQLKTSN
jgi:hypothetical protein